MDNTINLGFVISIIKVFSKDPSKEITIRQLSKKAGLSYKATYRTVKYLIKEGVLNVKQFGKSSVTSLNLNKKTKAFLNLSEVYTIKGAKARKT